MENGEGIEMKEMQNGEIEIMGIGNKKTESAEMENEEMDIIGIGNKEMENAEMGTKEIENNEMQNGESETKILENVAVDLIPQGNPGEHLTNMDRLKRFLVLGSEHNYYCGSTEKRFQNLEHNRNIKCVQNLLVANQCEEVLDTIQKYSLSGRCLKADPVLQILASCAVHEDNNIRNAAFQRVVKICDIPTKLFRFIDLTQDAINFRRKLNYLAPQCNKRKRIIIKDLELMKINDKQEDSSKCEEPPQKKKSKKVKPELKKVNKLPKKSSGWGRRRRKMVAQFYEDKEKDPNRLLYLMTKYKTRCKWSHQTVIRYTHPKITGEHEKAKNLVMMYCIHGYKRIEKEINEMAKRPGIEESLSQVIGYINVINALGKLSPEIDGDEGKLLAMLDQYGLREEYNEIILLSHDQKEHRGNIQGKKSNIHIVREHLPTEFLNSKKVWEALLRDMPMTALIRNLGKMSHLGLFDGDENEGNLQTAVSSLTNPQRLKAAKVHPMKVLIAMLTYKTGQGDEGHLEWHVNQRIVEALDEAFYMCFKQAEIVQRLATNKKYMLCLDVTNSMGRGGCGSCKYITPAMASTAMAMVTWNVEENVELVAFGDNMLKDLQKLGITKDMHIKDVFKKTKLMKSGITDCSLPMTHAKEKGIEVDAFIVYTDSDTRYCNVPPATALREYNETMHRDAKLIICGLQSNGFTIADPQNSNMIDIIGFDKYVPEIISEFVRI